MKQSKIDFVITWVDGNDEKFIKEKEEYLKKFLEKDNSGNKLHYSNSRFRDMGTLKYWFRGVEKYAPWVNKIYFVTNGQVPDWLNLNNPKLVLVQHEEFIPKKYLPTFSSEAIEVNLHRINGLSENFVYFNDDLFIIKNVAERDFFYHNLPCDAGILGIVSMDGSGYSNFNGTIILNKYFDKKEVMKKNFLKWFSFKYGIKLIKNILLYPYHSFSGMTELHVCNSLKKETFKTLWKLEPDVMERTSSNKFRTNNNINLWLLKNYQICKGDFHPRSIKFGKSLYLDDNNVNYIIENQKYKIVCINDHENLNDDDFEKLKEKLVSSFEKILSDKSSFEK